MLPFIFLLSISEDSANTILPEIELVIHQQTAAAEIDVRIDLVEIPLGTDSAVVDIMCDPNGMGIGGFELRISAISDLISIVAVESGGMQATNQWSMFNANETVPEKSWHIVSLARAMSNNDSLAVLTWAGSASIASLIVRFGEPAGYWDTTHTIQFEWHKCSDNSFSDSTGTNLMVGQIADEILVVTKNDQFVGSFGPPSDCFKNSPRPPADVIRFHNGGIIIRSNIEPAPMSDTVEIDTILPAKIN